ELRFRWFIAVGFVAADSHPDHTGQVRPAADPGGLARPKDEAALTLPAVAWGPVGAAAVLAFVLLMATSARYGYHRDELYFLAASRHLAWGYVDQPPLSVALAGLSRVLFGGSLVGLRVFPALADAGAVLLRGLLAREMGGRRLAQGLAALSLALAP